MRKVATYLRRRWALSLLIVMSICGIMHPFISNDLPVLAVKDGKYISPTGSEWLWNMGVVKSPPSNNAHYDNVIITPLINHKPEKVDITATLLPPMNKGHLLGTDVLGRDVAGGMIKGLSVALRIGFGGVAIALLIGILIGALAGLKNSTLYRMNIVQFGGMSLCLMLGLFHLKYSSSGVILLGVFILLAWASVKLASRLSIQKYDIPVSVWMDGLIKLRLAIPGIFLVLASLGLFSSYSVWNVILILGFIGWSGIARYVRGEMMRIRSLPFYQASEALGLSTWRKVTRHVIPNALDPILSTCTFTVASFVLVEATLSFLGIGLPPEIPTWGSLLAMARESSSWWLAIFPGLAIFLLIACLNSLSGQLLREARGRD